MALASSHLSGHAVTLWILPCAPLERWTSMRTPTGNHSLGEPSTHRSAKQIRRCSLPWQALLPWLNLPLPLPLPLQCLSMRREASTWGLWQWQ